MIRSDQSKSYLSELAKLAKYNLVACGYEQITVTGSLSSLTVPTDARYAIIAVESDASGVAVRYLELADITVPTTTSGFPRSNNDLFDLQGYQNLLNFRITQAQSGTHIINVAYYK